MQHLFRPVLTRFPCQLEYRGRGRAIEIAGVIKDQTGGGFFPVRTVEAMQHVLGPASACLRRQLEYCAKTVSSAGVGRAIQVTAGISDQASVGIGSVLAAEVMQHLLRPFSTCFGRQLEYCAHVISSAYVGRAVKIAGGIQDEAGIRMLPVLTVPEAMQHFLGPASTGFGRQLEYGALGVASACGSRAVKIAGGIEDHTCHREGPVRTAPAAIQYFLRPVPARFAYQLEHGPRVRSAAPVGRAEEVARRVDDQAGPRIGSVPGVAPEAIQ